MPSEAQCTADVAGLFRELDTDNSGDLNEKELTVHPATPALPWRCFEGAQHMTINCSLYSNILMAALVVGIITRSHEHVQHRSTEAAIILGQSQLRNTS